MRSTKTITTQVHRKRATAVLTKDTAWRWLASKSEILDELGRIDSDHVLLAIAQRLSEVKPSTGEAINIIRHHREHDQLADEIVHAVKEFMKRRPSTARSEVRAALESAGVLLCSVEPASVAGQHQFLRKM